MILKPRTLFAKLALTYVVIVCFAGYIYVKLFLFLWEEYLGAVEESTQWDLASTIEKEIQPHLTPTVDEQVLEKKLFMISQLNPKIDVFLIDANGKVLFFFGKETFLQQLDIEPIKRFLQHDGYPTRAILGTAPHSPGTPTNALFSAAPTTIGNAPGYIYVVLDGYRYRNIMHSLGDFSVFNASVIYVVLVSAIASLIGMGAFYFLTKRFRQMTSTVRAFKEGDYSQRILDTGDDEVGDHAMAFNDMADRLVENIEALENSDRLRRELIANVSHDVRAPVSAIHSLLETFQMKHRSMKEEEHEEFLERAIANCRALQSLINDLFELSKLNAATESINPQPLILDELLQDICVKYEPLSKERGVELKLQNGQSLPLVIGDTKMLNRALSNLIENAIRYTNTGGRINVQTAHSAGKIQVRIEDNGIGIDSKDLPHVFDRFYRAESGKKKNQRGTGLGLAIAKRIIDLHEQTLSVASTPGKGTTFSFELNSAEA